MNYRDHLRYFVICGIVFVLIYFVTAIKPLNKEFFLQTESSIYLNNEEQTADSTDGSFNAGENKAYPFRLKEYAGYFTESGKIIFARKIPFKATLSDSLWACYDNNSESIEIKNIDGSIASIIRSAGFPFLQDNRIYLLPPGGNSISEYTLSGARSWIYESYTPVTAFNSSSKGAVIGFADGALVCLTPDGKERFAFYPGGSTNEIILGTDISETEDMTACISGINNQRFVLTTFDSSKHKVVFHEYLNSDLHERALVQFSKDSSHVFYRYNGGLGIVDCKKLKSIHIPLKGAVVQIEELENQNLTLVLSRGDGEFFIYLLENSSKLVGSFSFGAQSAFITATSDGFFVGHDTTISKLNVERN
ncbi:MAG: hypothetical protein J6U06_01550 [Spirochaetaceae bacterium]|nr:hypothetical protein [Spirochaetaceae bacterium]